MALELWQLVRLARRWWWLLILGPVLGAVAAYAVSTQNTPEYRADAFVRINPIQVSSAVNFEQLRSVETLTPTYRLFTWTPEVLRPVIEDLGLDESVESLGDRVSAVVLNETQLMRVSAWDPNPEVAAEIANAVAASLVRFIATENASQNEGVRSAVDSQLIETRAQIDEITAQLLALAAGTDAADPATQAEIQRLETTRDQWQEIYAGLLQTARATDLNSAIASQQVTMAALALPPTVSDATSPQLLILFGGVAGFLVAAAVVSVLGLLDRTVRAGTNLRNLIGRPLLAAIPNAPSLRQPGEQLITLRQPDSAAAEAIRLLRINLELLATPNNLRTLAITSPGPGEGTSTVAANLAVAMAQTGVTTVLIDANLRRPSLHAIFGVDNDRGLSTLLTNADEHLSGVVTPTAVPGLTLVPGGPPPPVPADLLSRDRFSALLAEVAATAQAVIIDTPAMQVGTDALVIAPHVDGVVLVSRAGHTRLDAMQWAANALRPAALVAGVVLNRESDRHAEIAGAADAMPELSATQPPLSLEAGPNRP